ncbi:MAG: hypothetical protein ACHQAQ_09180 [Hyphomicrobiales bacterium]
MLSWRARETLIVKIVREHYPIAKLPEDLREGLDPDAMAVVTVTPEPRSGHKASPLDIVDEYRAKHAPRYRSDQEIVDLVRRIRDGDKL